MNIEITNTLDASTIDSFDCGEGFSTESRDIDRIE